MLQSFPADDGRGVAERDLSQHIRIVNLGYRGPSNPIVRRLDGSSASASASKR